MRFWRLSFIVAAASMVALPAFAASMEPRFGNTMLGTRPDGTVMKLYYNRDHTFSGEITPPHSTAVFEAKGKWWLDGKNLCVQQELPEGQGEAPKSCAELKGDKVGDKWQTTVHGADGKPEVQSVEIVKGRK